MDDHTAYVELLAELEGAGKAPKRHPNLKLAQRGAGWSYMDDVTLQFLGTTQYDAHNAIRVAAEDMLREWCKKHYRPMEIDDSSGDGGVTVLIGGRIGVRLGTGPTIAVALLNAVRAVRGMKETKA